MSVVRRLFPESSLSRRLTLYIVGSSLFIALVVSSSLIYLQAQTLYTQQCQSMAAVAQRTCDTAREMILDSQAILLMATNDDCFREMNVARVRHYFTHVMDAFRELQCFCLLDTAGNELVHIGCGESRCKGPCLAPGGCRKKRAIAALKNSPDAPYVGPVFIKNNRPMTSMIASIRDGGNWKGMIYATIDISRLSLMLSNLRIAGGNGYAYIVDQEGRIIAHNDFGYVLKRDKWSDIAAVKHVMTGSEHDPESGADRYQAWNGDEVIGVHAVIEPMGWGVVVEQPLSGVYAPIRAMAVRTALWVLAALAVLIALTIYLSRRITRPILALRDGVQQFADGNWDVFFDAKTGDEIQTLAGAFNRMAANLKNLYGQLHREIKRVSQSEQALRRSEEEYRGIFENAAEGISRSTLDGRFIIANPALVHMLGYDSMEELLPLNIERDIYASPDVRVRFLRLLTEQGRVKNFETTFKRRDGSIIWVSLNAHPLRNGDGEIIGSESITSDITKRKRAEELRCELEEFNTRILHAIPSFICVVEPDFRLSFVSEHAERFFGRRVDKMIGKWGLCLFGCVHKGEQACMEKPNCLECRDHPICLSCPLRKAVVAVLTRGEETVRREISLDIDFEGRVVQKVILFSVLALHWGGEDVALLLMDDITQHKQLETQLFQAQKMESIGLLAGGVAHDFNNLLTGIMGFTSLLLSRLDSDKPEYSHVKSIEQASQRASELVQQLLTFSRRAPKHPAPLRLNSLIDETRSLLTRIIPKNMSIEAACEPDLWVTEVDPAQMQQVIINICINARDAMPDGGRLTIETSNVVLDDTASLIRHSAKPGRYVSLAITDSGVGIPQEMVDRIFEPFFTTKGVGKGTGLGLAVAYATVKNHRGFIEVRSEIGRGTTFTVYLPATDDTLEDPQQELKVLPVGRETVLIIDDEALVRDVAGSILRDFGYTVIPASDPLEAVDLYRSRHREIDLVIIDLVMPQQGGIECLNELLKIDPGTTAILTSGYNVDGEAGGYLHAGAKAFMKKPFDVTELLTLVRNVLDDAEGRGPVGLGGS